MDYSSHPPILPYLKGLFARRTLNGMSLRVFFPPVSHTSLFFPASRSTMADLWSAFFSSLELVGGLILHQNCTTVYPKSNRSVSFPGSLLGGEPRSWLRNQWRAGLSQRQALLAVALIGYRLALNGAWVVELCCHGDSTICVCSGRRRRTCPSLSLSPLALSASVTLILIHPADARRAREGSGRMCVCEKGYRVNERELPKSLHKGVSSSIWKETNLFV